MTNMAMRQLMMMAAALLFVAVAHTIIVPALIENNAG